MSLEPDSANDIDELLRATADAQALQQAVRTLVKRRTLVRLTRTEGFGEVLKRIAELYSASHDNIVRLTVITALVRMGAVAKTVRPLIEELLGTIVTMPPGSPSELTEADDRLYLAIGLRSIRGEWIPEYAAQAAVEEEAGEKARSEFLSVLIDHSPDLGQAFAALAIALDGFSILTENPGDSAGRRFRRLIGALRDPIVSSLSEAGPHLPRQVGLLVEAAFASTGKPESIEVQEAVAEDLAALLHDIVRTRTQVMADAELYSAMRITRSWMEPAYWRYFAGKSQSIQRLVHDLIDAVILLGKQGVMSQSLRDETAQMLGSQDEATKHYQALGRLREDLPSNVRQWLLTGRQTQREVSSASEASLAGALDARLATALVDSERLSQVMLRIGEDALAELLMLNPALSSDLQTLMSRTQQLARQVVQIAEHRNLRISVPAGTIQAYSPVSHAFHGTSPIGRRVRLVTPIVERVSGNSAEVILKAAVEPVRD